ncbi:MAG: DNA mismatch repair protein MutS [Candidatus Dormibacteria bacterium]
MAALHLGEAAPSPTADVLSATEVAQRASVDLRETPPTTPILREYNAVKAEFPDAMVFARLGDFFELFGSDAQTAAPLLGLTLTGRGFGSAGRVSMCGVPERAATGYIRRLLEAGHRVCIWDQVEPAGDAGRGLVRREVTRVLSPGAVVEDGLIDPGTVARCAALLPSAAGVGLAALDASTGELQLAELSGDLGSGALAEELDQLDIAELVIPEGVRVPDHLVPRALRTHLPVQRFDSARGRERLLAVTATASLRGFGAEEMYEAQGAAGALLAWAERARLRLGDGFVHPRIRQRGTAMRLDAATRRNLEILAPLGSGGASLLRLLDRTTTAAGGRLLRGRLQEPLLDPGPIGERLDGVAALVSARGVRAELRRALGRVPDLERLTGRCVAAAASPRDLGAVRDGLQSLPACRDALASLNGVPAAMAAAGEACAVPPELAARLQASLVEQPPASRRDGGAVREGADTELDALRAAGAGARDFIAGLEAVERERSGIRALKLGYNRVFGYYLEVSHAQRQHPVPADYVRKQTLVGAERYITPDLKEQEALVLHARERALTRELEVLDELQAAVATAAAAVLRAAAAAAELDVTAALAEVADTEGWVRPVVDRSGVLEIAGGRHPLVERSLATGGFVANDCTLDVDGTRLLVLTGPNMAGKSTYLRQCAVITLLAQSGSFVPAAAARIGVCDRIFTRVGAQDDIGAGLSTFMVEMAETAHILNTATQRSLVILDEIGRGTSTYDGLAIAQAVVEYLHDAPQLGCRTLFATHYHELTELATTLRGVGNARVEVVEDGEAVVFLHRIVAGGADRSYGIHVARLAGVPRGVLQRAGGLLEELERNRPLGPAPAAVDQLALALPAAPATHPVLDQLDALDLDGLTPLAALNTLAEWRRRWNR